MQERKRRGERPWGMNRAFVGSDKVKCQGVQETYAILQFWQVMLYRDNYSNMIPLFAPLPYAPLRVSWFYIRLKKIAETIGMTWKQGNKKWGIYSWHLLTELLLRAGRDGLLIKLSARNVKTTTSLNLHSSHSLRRQWRRVWHTGNSVFRGHFLLRRS